MNLIHWHTISQCGTKSKYLLSPRKNYVKTPIHTMYIQSISKTILVSRNFYLQSVRATFRNHHNSMNHGVKIAEIPFYTFFAKISWKQYIIAWSPSGRLWFLQPAGANFIPRGEAPRDEIWLPKVCKNYTPPNRRSRNSIAI